MGRREKEIDGTGGEGGDRERGGERGGKLHGHTQTFMDNLTCMLLVWLWTRMKEVVPVQQTS